MISHGDRFIEAYFNDFTLQDLWNNSVAFTMGASRDFDLCLNDDIIIIPSMSPFAPPTVHIIGDPSYYRAFQYADNNGLIMRNRNDAGRFFGIELDATTTREIRSRNDIVPFEWDSLHVFDLYIPFEQNRACMNYWGGGFTTNVWGFHLQRA